MFVEKRIFKRMNRDKEPRMLTQGEYTTLLNGLVNVPMEGYDEEAIKSYPSTVLRSQGDNPANGGTEGAAQVIGSIAHNDKNSIIYFVWDLDDNHSILRYDTFTKRISTIMQWSGLNFRKEHTINKAELVNDLLYFTDGFNPPRCINIVRAESTHNNEGDDQYPQPYIEEYISLIKRPPRAPLEVELSQDESFTGSYLINDSFQFTYRYVYKDNEKSTLATPSKAITPVEEDPLTEDVLKHNVILITIPDWETLPTTISKIELVVRFNNGPEFRIWDIIERDDDGDMLRTFNFYNDSLGVTLPDKISFQQFDDVPLIIHGGLRLSKDRFFCNDFTTGYDHQDDIFMSIKINSASGGDLANQTIYRRVMSGEDWDCGISDYITLGPSYGDFYWKDNNGDYFKVSYFEDQNFATIKDGPLTLSDIEYTETSTTFCNDGNEYENTRTFSLQTFKTDVLIDKDSQRGNKILKKGERYSLGVVFSDNYNRHVGVFRRSFAHHVQVPRPDDPLADGTVYESITWVLLNPGDIPLWATDYQIVRSKVSKPFFLQGRSSDLIYGGKDKDNNFVLSKNKGNLSDIALYLDIDNLTRQKHGLGYLWSEGDRVTFWYGIRYVDRKIIGQEGRYLKLQFLDLGSLNPALVSQDAAYKLGQDDPVCVWYEIYTPGKRDIDELYHTVSEKYPINNAGTTAKAYSKTTGEIRGDVYSISRRFETYRVDSQGQYVIDEVDTPTLKYGTTVENITVEAMNPSDINYDRWVGDEGYTVKIIPEAKQERKRFVLKFSERFIQNSLINGLNTWNTEDAYSMPVDAGRGTTLGRSREILLYFHEKRTSSVYIGEGFINTTDEQQFLVKTVNVVGDDKQLRMNFGCINPESIVEYDDYVWFWDMNKGAFVRYSNEGLVPISYAGMQNDHYSLGKLLLPFRDDAKVFGGYDPFFDVIYWTFQPLTVQGPNEAQNPTFIGSTDPWGFWDTDASTSQWKYFSGHINIVETSLFNQTRTTDLVYQEINIESGRRIQFSVNWQAQDALNLSNATFTIYIGLTNDLDDIGSGQGIRTQNRNGADGNFGETTHQDGFPSNDDGQIANDNYKYLYVYIVGSNVSEFIAAIKSIEAVWDIGDGVVKTGIDFEGETVVFNPRSGWMGHTSFLPEMYSFINKTLISFRYGEIHEHSDFTVFNRFYGDLYYRELIFYGNSGGSKVKIWSNFRFDGSKLPREVSVVSNEFGGLPVGTVADNARMQEFVYIETEDGQKGKVYYHQMDNKEGVIVGNFRRDINTSDEQIRQLTGRGMPGGVDAEDYKMFNGHVIRGQIAKVTVRSNRFEDAGHLVSFTLLYRLSEASFV